MPGPTLEPVETDRDLPKEVDVVVIGAGVIGLATALSLADRGHRVAVLEKGRVAGEQSSRNWGWCRVARRDPREIPLAMEALRLWEGMDARLGRETGFRREGILFCANDTTGLAREEAWLDSARPHGVSSRMIGPEEIAALLPGAARRVAGALWTPDDGRAEPQKVGPAMAHALRAKGGIVVENCAVRVLDLEGGRVAGVVTERGRVKAQAVVLAGGAWSRLFSKGAGLRLPQLRVLNTVLRTTAAAEGPQGNAWVADFAIRRRLDGGFTIADGMNNTVPIVPDSFAFFRDFLPAWRAEGESLTLRLDRRFLEGWRQGRTPTAEGQSVFEEVRVLDPVPERKSVEAAMRHARAFFPFLEGVEVAQTWAGMIDATPDALPVISNVDAIPGFTIATGFSGHGFGISPAAGVLAADMVTGDDPLVDPAPFRFSRFSDGTPIVVLSPV